MRRWAGTPHRPTDSEFREPRGPPRAAKVGKTPVKAWAVVLGVLPHHRLPSPAQTSPRHLVSVPGTPLQEDPGSGVRACCMDEGSDFRPGGELSSY